MPAEDTPVVAARRARLKAWIDEHFQGRQVDFVTQTGINQGELSALIGGSKSFGEKKAEALEALAKMPRGYLVTPLLQADASPSHPAQLDAGKLRDAQRFLEDQFRARNILFVPSEHSMLLAAVYRELMTVSEPNWVEMTIRFGKQIEGQEDGRQREAGSSRAHDRERNGGSGKAAGTKARRAG